MTNTTNEEKTLELMPTKSGYYEITDALLKMAEWKDEQLEAEKQALINKACEWLEPVLKDLAGYYCGGDLIRDFKKVMEEKEK